MNSLKPITENEWIGLTLKDAVEKAKNIGYEFRIVEENGVSRMVEYSNKSNRVNLRLSSDRVIGVYPG